MNKLFYFSCFSLLTACATQTQARLSLSSADCGSQTKKDVVHVRNPKN